MILLETLKLNNFLSHEQTQITFKENQKLLIDGKSGSGKSSITEAILWALYGKGRSDNRGLIRRGTKNAEVSIKLINEESRIIITRSVSSSGKNTLTITQNKGPEGQFLPIERSGLKDHQDWIEKEFLKASYELFTNSIAYPQENENSFVKANASRRKDLLLEIIRAGNFDDLYTKTRDTITVKNLENAGTLVRIESLEGFIKSSKEVSIKYEPSKKLNDGVTVELELAKLKEKVLEDRLGDISRTGTEILEFKRSKEHFISSLLDITLQLESDERKIEEHNKIDIESIKKDIEKIDVLTKEASNIESELKENLTIQQRITQLLSDKPQRHNYESEIEEINKRLIPLIKETGKCPAGDACPFVIPINGQIQFLTDQITDKENKSKNEQLAMIEWDKKFALIPASKNTDELYKRYEDIKNNLNKLSSSKDALLRYEIFEKTLVEIQERKVKLEERKISINSEILSFDTLIKKAEETLTSLNSNQINIDLSNTKNSIRLLQAQKDSTALDMSLALKAKGDIETASKDLELLKSNMSKSTSELESLELLKEALSPRGVKAVVIDYLVPQLEDRINGVLQQMSDFKIRLDTQKATADEEGIKEGLFITIINSEGQEMPYENYSGGEKIKIIVSISEALSSIQNNIGFRIMDENIISLDSESTQSFVEVLIKLQEKFPQLLIISHLSDIKEIFEDKIEIKKTNGISKII